MGRVKQAPLQGSSSPHRRTRSSLSAISLPSLAATPRTSTRRRPLPKTVTIDRKKYPVTDVFYCFFRFVAERHRVFERRFAGEPQPWTEDTILANHPFTNVFRVLDRNSQYILREVIRKGSQDLKEMFFRVLLFRTFNKIETWELLDEELGPLRWSTFSVDKYERVLNNAKMTLYSGCYIIPAPQLGYSRNYSNHLRMIETMMVDDNLPVELKKMKHLKDVHGRICLYPSMGDFMSIQLVLDLNMMPHYNWSEDEWVALGPGSRACLSKMFAGSGPYSKPDQLAAIKYIRDHQHSWFYHCGVPLAQIPRLHTNRPAGLTLVDIEHALCECEKYSRAKFPEIVGRRTQVSKRLFVPRSAEAITAEIPANWLAKNAKPKAEWACPPPVDGTEDYYEVSHIVKENASQGLYLIRWVGYGPEDDTWMPAEELGSGAGRLVMEWEKAKAKINMGLKNRSTGAGLLKKKAGTANASARSKKSRQSL